jgi:hypothetical protein
MQFAHISRSLSSGMALLVLAGCGVAPSDSTSVSSDEPGSFTVTEVHVDADGKEAVKVHSRGGNLQPGLQTQDYAAHQTFCGNNAVRLYDATLEACAQHGCNELCVDYDGNSASPGANVYLGQYCVTPACSLSWNSQVRSYWSGRDNGAPHPNHLWRNYPGFSQCTEDLGWQFKYSNAGSCGQNSNYLIFADQQKKPECGTYGHHCCNNTDCYSTPQQPLVCQNPSPIAVCMKCGHNGELCCDGGSCINSNSQCINYGGGARCTPTLP